MWHNTLEALHTKRGVLVLSYLDCMPSFVTVTCVSLSVVVNVCRAVEFQPRNCFMLQPKLSAAENFVNEELAQFSCGLSNNYKFCMLIPFSYITAIIPINVTLTFKKGPNPSVENSRLAAHWRQFVIKSNSQQQTYSG